MKTEPLYDVFLCGYLTGPHVRQDFAVALVQVHRKFPGANVFNPAVMEQHNEEHGLRLQIEAVFESKLVVTLPGVRPALSEAPLSCRVALALAEAINIPVISLEDFTR